MVLVIERRIYYFILAILSALFLNLFLSISFTPEKWFRLSSDLLLFLPFLLITSSLSKKPNFWIHLFCLLICLFGLYRCLSLVSELVFHRPFSFFDIFLISELDYFIDQSLSAYEKSLFILVTLSTAILSYLVIFSISKWIVKSYRLSKKITLAGIFLGFFMIVFIQFLVIKEGDNFSVTRGLYLKDFVVFFDEALEGIKIKNNKDLVKKNLELSNSFLNKDAYDLSKISNTNVVIIFVESYGAVLVQNSDLFESYQSFYTEMNTKLEKKFFSMVTGYSAAPESSWLSRLSFSSGTKMDHRYIANLAMVSNLTTLNKKFSLEGHKTFSFMPGVTEHVEYIESFFDFEKRIRFWHLDWPADINPVGWAVIPDQFALEWLGRKSSFENLTPFYTEIVLSSSHTPFGEVPPYIPKGNFNLEDYPFIKKRNSLGILSHMESSPKKYMISIEYSLNSVCDFIEKYLSPEDLIIVIGDHQPPVLKTNSNLVPVHIISGKKSLLDPFEKIGFHNNLSQLKLKKHINHEDIAEFLLENYSSY